MAMGIVSDEELAGELDNVNKSTPASAIIKEKDVGRGNGNVGVPESLQKIIGETAIEEGNDEAIALANEFGINKGSVSAYKNGASSLGTYNEPHPTLAPHVSTVKSKIAGRARKKLLKSIAAITSSKLEEASARELSGVAKDMSAIARDMDSGTDDGPNVAFVLVTPKQRSIEQFTVIDVEE